MLASRLAKGCDAAGMRQASATDDRQLMRSHVESHFPSSWTFRLFVFRRVSFCDAERGRRKYRTRDACVLN